MMTTGTQPTRESARVFILEEPRRNLDISSAERFGEIVYLFDPTERRPSIFNAKAYIDAVRCALEGWEFDPNHDFFVVAGSMNNVALAMVALASYAAGMGVTPQLLLFDSTVGSYRLAEIGEIEAHVPHD